MTTLDANKIHLRDEAVDDQSFLVQLFNSTRESGLSQLGWEPTEIQSFLKQQYDAQYQSYRQYYPDADYRLIEYDGEAIGRLYLNRDREEYRLIDIALVPEYRNNQLGSLLINNIMQEAGEIGKPVSLHVEHSNPARSLYQRLGFVEKDVTSMYLFLSWTPESTLQ